MHIPRFHWYATVLLMLVVAAVGIAQQAAEQRPLGDIARELRNKKESVPAAATPVASASTTAEPESKSVSAKIVAQPADLEPLQNQARALLLREQFEDLDKLADGIRASKARFSGGAWKLTYLYDALDEPRFGSSANEETWKAHIALLKRWMDARPQSITARVALAEAYLEYAWIARGSGYSDSVTPEGWRLYGERLNEAGKILVDASSLPAKCPHWYDVMLLVARASGADKDQLRAIFEKAIASEPNYYAYYQDFAYSLLPKWVGEPGDLEQFADETYRRVGGKNGAYLYFEIVSGLCGNCGEFETSDFSWQRIQEGYAALEEMYGLSPLKVNRFAYLAARYGDKAVAARAFERIGENWDSSVWGSRARFESQRQWAGVKATPAPSNTIYPASRAAGQLDALEIEAATAWNQQRWADMQKFALQAVELGKASRDLPSYLGNAYVMLASSDNQLGLTKDADQALRAAVPAVAERTSDPHVLCVIASQAAPIAVQVHDNVLAETYFRQAIEYAVKAGGANDPNVAQQTVSYGDFLWQQSRNEEALQKYRSAIEMHEKVRHDDPVIILPLSRVGDIDMRLGRNQEAEEVIKRMLRLMESRDGLESPTLVEPLTMLAMLYRNTGNVQGELRMRARIQEIQKNGAQ